MRLSEVRFFGFFIPWRKSRAGALVVASAAAWLALSAAELNSGNAGLAIGWSIVAVSIWVLLKLDLALLLVLSYQFSTNLNHLDSIDANVRLWYILAVVAPLLAGLRRTVEWRKIFPWLLSVIGWSAMASGLTALSYANAPDKDSGLFLSSLTTLTLSFFGFVGAFLWWAASSRQLREQMVLVIVMSPIFPVIFWLATLAVGESTKRLEFPLGKPNSLAVFFLLGLAVLIASKSHWQPWTRYSAAFGLIVGIIMTGSRATALAVIALLIVVALLSYFNGAVEQAREAVFMSFLLVPGFLVVYGLGYVRGVVYDVTGVGDRRSVGVARRLVSEGDDSVTGNIRLRIWEEALHVVGNFPWTGVGLRHASLHLELAHHPHNIWIGFALETGVIGFTFVALTVGALIWLSKIALPRQKFLVLLASTLAIAGAFSLIGAWDLQILWWVAGLVFGLGVSSRLSAQCEQGVPRRGPSTQ